MWWQKCYVHRTVPNHKNQARSRKLSAWSRKGSHIQPKQKGNRDVDQLSHVDYVTTNAHSSQGESQLYIFEDNEALIKMIIKGRCPTMRHVSKTHRVALGWLLDRKNLDPKIQIKFVDTNNQLADILTKGNFTRDEWNHLFRMLNIMIFPVFSFSNLCKFLSDLIRKQCAMSKKVQESNQKEGSAGAKPKPMNLNLLSMRKIPSQEVTDPNRPGNQSLDQSGVPARIWKQSAQRRSPSLQKAEARFPQYADLRFMVLGESLQEQNEQRRILQKMHHLWGSKDTETNI